MNNKAIIEFGFCRIWRILQISEDVIHLGLRAWWITASSTCRILHILLSLIQELSNIPRVTPYQHSIQVSVATDPIILFSYAAFASLFFRLKHVQLTFLLIKNPRPIVSTFSILEGQTNNITLSLFASKMNESTNIL